MTNRKAYAVIRSALSEVETTRTRRARNVHSVRRTPLVTLLNQPRAKRSCASRKVCLAEQYVSLDVLFACLVFVEM